MFCSTGSPSALSLFAPAHSSHSPRDAHNLYSELFSGRTGQTSSRAQVSYQQQQQQQRGSKTSLLSRISSASSSSSASSRKGSSSPAPSQLGVMVYREVIQCSR